MREEQPKLSGPLMLAVHMIPVSQQGTEKERRMVLGALVLDLGGL